MINLFWSKYKQNTVSSGPSHDAFDVDGTVVTEPIDILNMWASHYETVGLPSTYDFDPECK